MTKSDWYPVIFIVTWAWSWAYIAWRMDSAVWVYALASAVLATGLFVYGLYAEVADE
ncbi:MAG: hypothetical protein GTO60_16590 [Gammaproteobacteria bacterium]|nr:hypothetical protein [Gammaproteobacteria bacterium]